MLVEDDGELADPEVPLVEPVAPDCPLISELEPAVPVVPPVVLVVEDWGGFCEPVASPVDPLVPVPDEDCPLMSPVVPVVPLLVPAAAPLSVLVGLLVLVPLVDVLFWPVWSVELLVPAVPFWSVVWFGLSLPGVAF